MLRDARSPAKRLYAVEVSGWDGTESFFVEKCELEWNEESGKQVALKRELNNNAILLVRLLQLDESNRSHPVVYEAELLGKTTSGLYQFRLNAVVPRLREEGKARFASAINSAGVGEGSAEFRTETTR